MAVRITIKSLTNFLCLGPGVGIIKKINKIIKTKTEFKSTYTKSERRKSQQGEKDTTNAERRSLPKTPKGRYRSRKRHSRKDFDSVEQRFLNCGPCSYYRGYAKL